MKPVAYVDNRCNDSIEWLVDPLKLDEGTPLYPAPRELSDEEIKQVIDNISHYGNIAKDDYVSFAKAILKKASEK